MTASKTDAVAMLAQHPARFLLLSQAEAHLLDVASDLPPEAPLRRAMERRLRRRLAELWIAHAETLAQGRQTV